MDEKPKRKNDELYDDSGNNWMEYALILLTVGVTSMVLLAIMGSAIGNIFSNIVCTFPG